MGLFRSNSSIGPVVLLCLELSEVNRRVSRMSEAPPPLPRPPPPSPSSTREQTAAMPFHQCGLSRMPGFQSTLPWTRRKAGASAPSSQKQGMQTHTRLHRLVFCFFLPCSDGWRRQLIVTMPWRYRFGLRPLGRAAGHGSHVPVVTSPDTRGVYLRSRSTKVKGTRIPG